MHLMPAPRQAPLKRKIALYALAACAGGACFAQGNMPIVIGQTYIASGPVAGFSKEPLLGIKALLASVNKAGGIKGREVLITQLDDENSMDKAQANVRELVKQGAVAILMPIGTLPTLGALKVATELNIPVIGPYTGADTAYVTDAPIFPLRISFAEEALRIVRHTALIGQTRIAAVRNSNPGAKVPIDAARKALQARGLDLIGEIVLSQDGSDAQTKAAELAALAPQGVIVSASNVVTAKFIKAYRTKGISSQFYCTSFLNGRQLHEDIGAAANGVVIMQVVPSPKSPTRLAADYRTSMQAIGLGSQLSYASFEGYIAARTLVEALRKVPATSINSIAVKDALQSMSGYSLGDLKINLKDKTYGALNYGELSMIGRNGAFVR